MNLYHLRKIDLLRSFRHFINQFLFVLFGLMLVMAVFFGVLYIYMEVALPDVSILNDVHMQVPLQIYSADNQLIAEYGAKRRAPVKINQVPKQLIEAVLATEDARFYSHPGVDFVGLVRASIAVLESGKKVQGASTITMQVARNFFLTRKKTYSRKIREILLAIKIDKTLSKEKILELYLNKVYFGNRAYGVAAAAHVYYGKSLDQLTLPEMAMIAGLPQAPSRNNPLRNPDNALTRRNHVLRRMYDVGFINKATYEQAIKAPSTAQYHEERASLQAPYVAEMARQVVLMMYGPRVYESGVKVYTTITSSMQNDAVHSLQLGLIAYSNRHGYVKPTVNLGLPSVENVVMWKTWLQDQPAIEGIQAAVVTDVASQQVTVMLADGTNVVVPWAGLSWARPALSDGYVGEEQKTTSQIASVGDVIYVTYLADKKYWQLTQVPQVQGAIVVLNPKDGAILALQGGFDFEMSAFNRVLQAQRQPGSSFKPFLYSAAFDKGFTLASTINDAPIMIRDTGENAWWRPENDTMQFYGPTRLRVALAESRNLVSIRLLRAIGIPYAVNYIQRFGFDAQQLPRALSLALGSNVVTPMQIASGYTVFANGGYRVAPYFIGKITENHQVLYQASVANSPAVITPQNAYLVTQGLKSVIEEGTAKAAKKLNRPDLAGKTGTTNNQVDAWFSGFNSNVLATVWVGYDNHEQSLHEYGAQTALPIWMEFMQSALANQPPASMPEPTGMVTARINPQTGALASAGEKKAIFEVFTQDTMPTTVAQQHTQVVSNSHASSGNDVGGVSSGGDDIF